MRFRSLARRFPGSLISVAALVGAANAAYPEFPYPNSSYDEEYRGQYHFSSKGGWMNDINGLWYDDGIYHLSYQHYPHGTEWNTMHWGHATSSDLLHWVQQPIMLEPDDNVPGDCWSGSVVVDVNNTSGLKTGANNVYVAIYTATTIGTCLAYSNDKGATWQSYSGNPVKPGGEDPRDPHVLWHAPTNKWIMLLYENGTTFYTSTNLKDWTFASNFGWGYECPDFYELAIDDGATKKWVLNDASGNYYIGTFDGTEFTADAGGPWRMDEGPDFYAPQTYYRPTFPDNRVVQIAWHSNWENEGGATSPWARNATFPCELKLKTFPDGVRLTRYPVAEISTLYDTPNQWPTQTLSQGQDLLSGISSKSFDLIAEFDLVGATATQITFTLANKTVTYDVPNNLLLGQSLTPIIDRVKIRILADWSQLEVFGNEGQLSWSENFEFTPSASNLGLTVNGNVTLVSMSFSPVKRTWDGATATQTPVASIASPFKPKSARVFDSRGRQVAAMDINKATINRKDFGHVPSGMLFVEQSDGKQVVRTRMPFVKR